jgi:hypothetical protein
MIKLFLLMVYLFIGSYALHADETPGSDQDFMKQLDAVKDPFEDGLPKPVAVVVVPPPPRVVLPPVVAPVKLPPPVIELPELKLQGVIVGDGIYQAIINDTVVPLQGSIARAQVIDVNKKGVELLFKGKKFFLKVD